MAGTPAPPMALSFLQGCGAPCTPPASHCVLLILLRPSCSGFLPWPRSGGPQGLRRSTGQGAVPLPRPSLWQGLRDLVFQARPRHPAQIFLAYRLIPCLYLLLGEVWVHGALSSRALGGAAWVAQPCLPRTPLDWDSELRWGREKLWQLCHVTLGRPGLGLHRAYGDTG